MAVLCMRGGNSNFIYVEMHFLHLQRRCKQCQRLFAILGLICFGVFFGFFFFFFFFNEVIEQSKLGKIGLAMESDDLHLRKPPWICCHNFIMKN